MRLICLFAGCCWEPLGQAKLGGEVLLSQVCRRCGAHRYVRA